MEIAEGGRNCQQCDKLIVDYSDSTQAEIQAAYQQSKDEGQELCGRFKVSQVFQPSRPKFTWRKSVMRRFALSVLMVFGAFLFNLSGAKADSYLTSIRTIANQALDGSANDSTSTRHTITGTVREVNGETLPFATVMLEYGDKVYGATSDIDGNYAFEYDFVPDNDSLKAKITVKYVGFLNYEISTLDLALKTQKLDFVLHQIKPVEIDTPVITYCVGVVHGPPPTIEIESIKPLAMEIYREADYYRTDEIEFSDDDSY